MELIDGAQLVASDLSRLADVPGLDNGAGGAGGGIAGARGAYHLIDFLLGSEPFPLRAPACRIIPSEPPSANFLGAARGFASGGGGRGQEIEPGTQPDHRQGMNLRDARFANAERGSTSFMVSSS